MYELGKSMTFQKEYWENKKISKRRSPLHPVIEAFARPKVDKIIETIRQDTPHFFSQKNRLLDIGSGNGYLSHYLNNPFDVTCLDFSRNMLSICPLEKKIQASASLLPFKAASFDIVFCANLLHHVERPSLVISEMTRVSSRYVIVLEPNRNNPLMFLFALVMRADRNIIKLSAATLKRLTEQRLDIMLLEPTGSILPNVTPLFLLPLLKDIEMTLHPKFYQLLIAKKKCA